MDGLLDFWIKEWDNILLILTGFLAFAVYFLQKKAEKRNAAILVLSQINELKEKISKVTEIISGNQLNLTEIYETLDILNDNQWNKYKHLFASKIDSNSIRIIDRFYESVSLIREQLVLAKNIQQQAFFYNQQTMTNDCNEFLMHEFENAKDMEYDIKRNLNSIMTNNSSDEQIKNLTVKMFEGQPFLNTTRMQITNDYFQKINALKSIFCSDNIFIQYLPVQIRSTIEKELNKISQIEIIGCPGYKKLKQISKIK